MFILSYVPIKWKNFLVYSVMVLGSLIKHWLFFACALCVCVLMKSLKFFANIISYIGAYKITCPDVFGICD